MIQRRRKMQLISEPDRQRKALLFKETRDRTLDSQVNPLPNGYRHHGVLAHESSGCPEPTRVGYRSSDRQWIIPDRRVIDFPRPELWEAQREGQVPRATSVHLGAADAAGCMGAPACI